MYFDGRGVKQDYAQAVEWYNKSAAQNYIPAMMSLASIYEYGNGVTQNLATSTDWYCKAADLGSGEAAYIVAGIYQQGEGNGQIAPDLAKVVKYYQIAVAQNVPAAMINLAAMYKSGTGVPRDYDQALKLLQRAAQLGASRATTAIGLLYAEGAPDVPPDYRKAAHFYRIAADKGDPEGQVGLAGLYVTGKGVKQDYAEALKLYISAAQQGSAYAQEYLANMYYNATGVARDYDQAFKWYSHCAEQGSLHCETMLGYMYYAGQGVKPNDDEAGRWYEKSAINGDTDSQDYLGVMYGDGRGVKQDWNKSYMWLSKAAAGGNEQAKKDLSMAAAHLSPAEQAQARGNVATIPGPPSQMDLTVDYWQKHHLTRTERMLVGLAIRLFATSIIYLPLSIGLFIWNKLRLKHMSQLLQGGQTAKGTITNAKRYVASGGMGLIVRYNFTNGFGGVESGKVRIIQNRVPDISRFQAGAAVDVSYLDNKPSTNAIVGLIQPKLDSIKSYDRKLTILLPLTILCCLGSAGYLAYIVIWH